MSRNSEREVDVLGYPKAEFIFLDSAYDTASTFYTSSLMIF